MSAMILPTSKERLYERGVERLEKFCDRNKLAMPAVNNVPPEDWMVGACAYYRPDTERMRKRTTTGISICLTECQRPCGAEQSRNWSWPGSTVDREPFGVLCHELGHHADWSTGEKKWTYGSEYCEQVQQEAGEAGLTSYANENPAEWFAEAFRLFVSNHALLKLVRPKTWEILRRKWTPVSGDNWLFELGSNCPPRVVAAQRKKFA